MNKITSGKWTLAPVERNPFEFDINSGDYCVAIACGFAGDGNTESNARLIAAAPELLDALETLAEHFEYFMGDNECRPLENARAAIAKAKGE